MFAVTPLRETFGPGTDFPSLVIDLATADGELAAHIRSLPCPVIGVGTGALAPACDTVVADAAHAARMARKIAAAPIAAMVLVQHLRASESLPISHALTAESMAYATVQMGPEFQQWRARRPQLAEFDELGPPVLIDHVADTIYLSMNRAQSHNAIGTELRDALCDAMAVAAIDSDIARVVLRGTGRCFSVGGDIREFGQATDPATAHWVRSLRLPAAHAAAMADRLDVYIAGAAIGAGIEIAAFAHRIVATADSWFQLPELDYGLIPGAGGTVSIVRRIGRQRAAEMMLSGRRVRATEALAWGLIDAIDG